MSTNEKDNKKKRGRPVYILELSTSPVQRFTNFFNKMNSIDLNSPSARLNETSISDNNGGRIELNQSSFIKK